ncbi:MAG: NOL1/NOP2/sun family putative RNA methylase, partial [Promethearchaeota archaeon]
MSILGFKNPKLKFYEFKPSERAIELANEFKYMPYMIERYLSMFNGERETLDFLNANEKQNPVAIRINTIKTEPKETINRLNRKGYIFKKTEFGENTFEIEKEPKEYNIKIEQKKRGKKERNFENIGTYLQEKRDFTRDRKSLKSLEWGKPIYRGNEKSKINNGMASDFSRTVNKKHLKIRDKGIATLGSTNEYLMGHYYIQNKVATLPAFYLNPGDEDQIIDMCASPGGKTTQLAAIMKNAGSIIAVEINYERIRSLIYNLRRMGVRNTTVLNIDANEITKIGIHPDKILVDSPCTGEGLIREDPSRKHSKTPVDIKKAMILQNKLLTSAIKAVNPGGYVMYSTCSIAPEENEFVIQNILDTFPKAEVAYIDDDVGLPGYTEE